MKPGGEPGFADVADVSRASRVALEGSRCMDGSVANMYVAKGSAEGSRTEPSRNPKAMEKSRWEIHWKSISK